MHTTFDKYLKILHMQGSMVQNDLTRTMMERNLNHFIEVAKNQKYDSNMVDLDQLVEIYLNFEDTKSTG